jgi:hypothetical protein
MSVRMEQSDDPKTITFQLEGKWAASDLLELSERCNQMLDEMSYRVDMIGDLSLAQIPPRSLRDISLRQREHPNASLIVLVGLNPLLRTILLILQRIYPRRLERLKTASTWERAEAHIVHSRDAP